MSDDSRRAQRELVVHFARSNRQAGRSRLDYLDGRLLAIVAVILVLGLVRQLATGRSIFWTLLLFVVAGALFLAYYRLRQANVTLYVRGDRIGLTNSLGLRKDVPISQVAAMVMCSVSLPRRAQPLPTLLTVAKSGRCLFRLSGGDQLGLTGIREVASAAGVELRGGWTDTLSLDGIEARYPGCGSEAASFFAWILNHRRWVNWVIIVGTILVFLGLVVVDTSH
jgi:hypothetical protein